VHKIAFTDAVHRIANFDSATQNFIAKVWSDLFLLKNKE